jgi:hypothetical protein
MEDLVRLAAMEEDLAGGHHGYDLRWRKEGAGDGL